MTRSARVTALLDSAVAVVAAGGLRGLTHRAVDGHARVPTGSTSYYFRTRQALLQAMAEYVAELEQRDIDQASVSPELADAPMVVQAADAIAGVLAHWLGPARERTKVRLEIWLLAAEQPELRQALAGIRDRFFENGRALLESMGSAEPDRHAFLILALFEGIAYDGVTRPSSEPPDRGALRDAMTTVLRAAVPSA